MKFKISKIYILSIATSFGLTNSIAIADFQSTGQLTVVPFQMGSTWDGDAYSTSTHSKNTFVAYLPPCNSNSEDICIKEVKFLKDEVGETKLVPQPLKTNLPVQPSSAYVAEEWVQDPMRGLPVGSRPGYWNLNGQEILIAASVSGSFNGNWESKETKFKVHDVRVSIASTDMPALSDYRISITLDLKKYLNKINLFLTGRVEQPEISTADNNLTVSGYPTLVYQAQPATFKLDSLPVDVKNYFINLCSYSRCFDIADPNSWTSSTKSINFSFREIKDFQVFEKYLSESANKKAYIWQIEGSGFNFMNYAKKDCFVKGSVNGFLTTNAMLYNPMPPTWNSQDNSINYTVASIHLAENGKVIKGNYNLILSTPVAKCIWNVNEMPLQARIGIDYSDSNPDISTLTLKKNNDWVSFNVDNFHFSTPRISIKLLNNQPKPIVIECVRGNKLKKVSGFNPKCPNGYKIK